MKVKADLPSKSPDRDPRASARGKALPPPPPRAKSRAVQPRPLPVPSATQTVMGGALAPDIPPHNNGDAPGDGTAPTGAETPPIVGSPALTVSQSARLVGAAVPPGADEGAAADGALDDIDLAHPHPLSALWPALLRRERRELFLVAIAGVGLIIGFSTVLAMMTPSSRPSAAQSLPSPSTSAAETNQLSNRSAPGSSTAATADPGADPTPAAATALPGAAATAAPASSAALELPADPPNDEPQPSAVALASAPAAHRAPPTSKGSTQKAAPSATAPPPAAAAQQQQPAATTPRSAACNPPYRVDFFGNKVAKPGC